MYPYTHALAGSVLASASYPEQKRLWLMAALGGLMPDVGIALQAVWNLFHHRPPLSRLAPLLLPYNDIMHSILAWLLFVWLAKLLASRLSSKAFMLGTVSHCLLDMLSHGRHGTWCNYLWPLPKQFSVCPWVGVWNYMPVPQSILPKPAEAMFVGLLCLVLLWPQKTGFKMKWPLKASWLPE